ncbi:SET domain-containing protein [Trametes gibbosa]|nr:SET domain-containing protein [Trametes gibbosa]
MIVDDHEPSNVTAFKTWLVNNGAHIHPHAHFQEMASGFDVTAAGDIPADTTVVSIPFSLAITPEVSREALASTLDAQNETSLSLAGLSERQSICAYLCMHWIADRTLHVLRHGPYVDTLPAPEKLQTPLHFTPTELEAFRDSNLHGATLDRLKEWEAEWKQCRAVISSANQSWADEFTWERYLTASTYLSSRAFPSTVLSETPSLVATPSSYPVLLPGIDSLNHARAHPVSWVVSHGRGASASSGTQLSASSEPSISLVIHTSTAKGSQLLNNYGPKPNSELILGYGFSLAHNPDDTIVLKLGGSAAASSPAPSSSRWEVGRNARGAEPVWEAVLDAIGAQNGDEEADAETGEPPSVEDDLCAADMLAEMAQSLYDRLPPYPPLNAGEMRALVVEMLEHYVEGQRDILQSLVEFAREKESRALQRARELGLDIIEEDEELEEE